MLSPSSLIRGDVQSVNCNTDPRDDGYFSGFFALRRPALKFCQEPRRCFAKGLHFILSAAGSGLAGGLHGQQPAGRKIENVRIQGGEIRNV